ncbi:hypothetical protein BMS3Abin05_00216 [bacterium BMS3Abin05]|nr:hypothetical protein BMS3Abin05_00216 [bacterium BMS3Abin05]GBE28728.1 hypothetical protein BMS3Bbin03_02678 [bacterium BMS3Bbin03]HDZ11841.1 hypothetical protein [Bacteroidota bacterium]
MKKGFLLILMLFFVFILNAPLFAGEWESFTVKNYRILYHHYQAKLAREVAETILKAEPKYQSVFGEIPKDTIRVLLADKRKEFDRLTYNTIPEWSKGVTRPDIHLIVLLTAEIKQDEFFSVVRHELVHAWMGSLYPGIQTPRWFDEGMAVLLSGEQVSGNNAVLSRAILTGSLFSLDEVNNVLKFGRTKARLAYSESYTALQFFVEYFGWQKFPFFFQKLKKTRSFEVALKATTGLSLFEFEDTFEDFARKKYRWQVFFDVNLYLWLALPVFVGVSFWLIKYRNRKRVEIWEEGTKGENDAV